MRPLAIAYGNNRQAKTWTNKTITFDDLKERLKVTIRTPESAEEYAKFNKAKRDTVICGRCLERWQKKNRYCGASFYGCFGW